MELSRKGSKRELESHVGSGRRLCSLQYISNNISGHQVRGRVFWDKTPTAPSWKLTGAIFLLHLLLLAPTPSPSSLRGIRASREVLHVFRSLPKQVPGEYCTLYTMWAPERSHSADFLYHKAHESLKNITPHLLETESKVKALGLDPDFRHRTPGAMLAHR